MTHLAIISAGPDVIDVHADSNGWFEVPLSAGYYNITWMTGTKDVGGCRDFDETSAIYVAPGHPTPFKRTYTSCIQGTD